MTYPELEGRTALVTGGTSGIGKACVERLRAEGMTVVFTGRNESAVRPWPPRRAPASCGVTRATAPPRIARWRRPSRSAEDGWTRSSPTRES